MRWEAEAAASLIGIRLRSAAATRRLGRRLGLALRPGDRLDLRGSVGAGKTTLAQAALTACLGPGVYRSPTFVLVCSYPQGLVHADLYRLEPSAAAELRLDELLDPADRAIVEWGERLPATWAPERLEVHLFGRRGRRAYLRARGAGGRALLGRALGDWATVTAARRDAS